MLDRLMGVLTLKAPVYKEIAEDKNATTSAAVIVIVMALITGILGALVLAVVGSALPAGTATVSTNPVVSIIRTLISAIVSWLIGGWVIAFVSKTFFGGKTDTGEMLRVFGYTQIFQIIGIVPCLGTIVALVLSLIAAVIGIREASEFDTTKAILTAVVAFIILVIVSVILGTLLALVGLV
jgi:hypothetical protein